MQLKRTEIRQSVIESSSAMIEALVRDGQPFHLVGEHLVAARAQHACVDLVEPPGVVVDLEFRALPSGAHAKGSHHARRCLLPSWLDGSFGAMFGAA